MSAHYDLPAFLHEDMDPRQPLDMLPEKKIITIDVNEFLRTRDALSTAYSELAASIDRAVKAYLEHTNVVLAGDASLNMSLLTQPFNQLATTAQQALMQGQGMLHMNPITADHDQTQNGEPTKDGKRRRAYKKRDPNAPKRPLTAYFRYLQEKRHSLKHEMDALKEGPGKPGDISKLATEKWNAMSEAEQKPYRDQYQNDLKDYEKAVSEFKGAEFKVKKPKAASTVVAGPDLVPGPALEVYEEVDESDSSVDAEHEEVPMEVPAKTAKGKRAATATASPERKRKSDSTTEGPAKKRGRKAKADLAPASADETPVKNQKKAKKN